MNLTLEGINLKHLAEINQRAAYTSVKFSGYYLIVSGNIIS
jgi:hypothetical protein